MTDKQSYVCIGSIGAYRPGDIIAAGTLTDERIKSLLDAGMIKATVGDQTPTPPPVDSVTLAWFNDATGFQAQSWDAAVEMVLIGQLAVKLAAPESLPAMLPEMPAPAPEPTPPVEAAPAPEPAPQLEPTVADIKAALDAKGVKYSTRDTKADLLALLNA